jgi:ABC-type phosphate transport system substrate-binding protein
MRHVESLFLAAIWVATSVASAGQIKVIANSSMPASSISADELKDVFLMTKTALRDGSHVEPVLLKGGATHASFIKEYLRKTESGLETYYRSLVFSGKGSMPKALATDAEVEAYVAKTKGAIGYVSSASDAAGVKTLDVK